MHRDGVVHRMQRPLLPDIVWLVECSEAYQSMSSPDDENDTSTANELGPARSEQRNCNLDQVPADRNFPAEAFAISNACFASAVETAVIVLVSVTPPPAPAVASTPITASGFGAS